MEFYKCHFVTIRYSPSLANTRNQSRIKSPSRIEITEKNGNQINQSAEKADDWNETRKSEMEREKKRSSVKKFPNNQVIILITNHIDLAARTAAKYTN